MKEIWKDITNYEGLYKVSNTGKVFSMYSQRCLKSFLNKYGYPSVILSKKAHTHTFHIHRLVAKAFLVPICGKNEIDHIDTNRKNNNVTNLRWVTRKENAHNPLSTKNYRDMALRLRHWEGKERAIRQLDKEENIICIYRSAREAERRTNIAHQSIAKVLKKKSKLAGGYKWEYIED